MASDGMTSDSGGDGGGIEGLSMDSMDEDAPLAPSPMEVTMVVKKQISVHALLTHTHVASSTLHHPHCTAHLLESLPSLSSLVVLPTSLWAARCCSSSNGQLLRHLSLRARPKRS